MIFVNNLLHKALFLESKVDQVVVVNEHSDFLISSQFLCLQYIVLDRTTLVLYSISVGLEVRVLSV
jgi:hypothetical protein